MSGLNIEDLVALGVCTIGVIVNLAFIDYTLEKILHELRKLNSKDK